VAEWGAWLSTQGEGTFRGDALSCVLLSTQGEGTFRGDALSCVLLCNRLSDHLAQAAAKHLDGRLVVHKVRSGAGCLLLIMVEFWYLFVAVCVDPS
jgi:hypothetical protein